MVRYVNLSPHIERGNQRHPSILKTLYMHFLQHPMQHRPWLAVRKPNNERQLSPDPVVACKENMDLKLTDRAHTNAEAKL